jgi:hypothetical protein
MVQIHPPHRIIGYDSGGIPKSPNWLMPAPLPIILSKRLIILDHRPEFEPVVYDTVLPVVV